MATGNAQSWGHPWLRYRYWPWYLLRPGHQVALQVRPQDFWTALLLLGPLEESR